MDKSVFKNESIDKLSSPEQLNDYIHVASPSIWIILVAIIVFLVGALIWGMFGYVTIKNGEVQKQVHPISFAVN